MEIEELLVNAWKACENYDQPDYIVINPYYYDYFALLMLLRYTRPKNKKARDNMVNRLTKKFKR